LALEAVVRRKQPILQQQQKGVLAAILCFPLLRPQGVGEQDRMTHQRGLVFRVVLVAVREEQVLTLGELAIPLQ